MRVRDDDVFKLVGRYKSYGQVVDRFKQIHKIIADEGAIHVVALICGTLDWFPGGVEFLKKAFDKEELIPEIHGLDHINYANLPKDEIIYHLDRCKYTIRNIFGYCPTRFYTPWGANAEHIKVATESVGLKLVDCSDVLYPKRKFFGGKLWESYSQLVREEKQELFIHWYEDKWFKEDTHSLVKTLRVIKNNDPSYFK